MNRGFYYSRGSEVHRDYGDSRLTNPVCEASCSSTADKIAKGLNLQEMADILDTEVQYQGVKMRVEEILRQLSTEQLLEDTFIQVLEDGIHSGEIKVEGDEHD